MDHYGNQIYYKSKNKTFHNGKFFFYNPYNKCIIISGSSI